MSRTICKSGKIGDSTFMILNQGSEVYVDVSYDNAIYEKHYFINSKKGKVERFIETKISESERRNYR
jgi:hypothetical protein